MVVHIYGLPVDMAPVLVLATQYRLKVMEDAAQMHGQTYLGRPYGSFGDIGTLSFYPNKRVTTGEGGMVLTDDDRLAERCRSLRNLCFQSKKRFVHEKLGYNFRMTNMQTAVGLAQLEWLGGVRRQQAQDRITVYRTAVKCVGFRVDAGKDSVCGQHVRVYEMMLKDELPFDADEAMRRIGHLGIGTRPFLRPMHEQPVFHKMGFFQDANYPVTERLAQRGFYLPSGMALRDD